LKQGIVLFAHGSSDPQWSRPFEQIALSLKKHLPAVTVAIAFLEHGTSLDEAIAALVAKGAASIRVIPVFLGQGRHVNEDLPRLVSDARRTFAGVTLVLEKTIGEQPKIIEAIAGVIAQTP
jgi:sirohydrochlorin cobaltochelatase